MFSRICGFSLGVGRVRSCACISRYSAADNGLPSTGDRASKIISVRNTSSGVSWGGSDDKATLLVSVNKVIQMLAAALT